MELTLYILALLVILFSLCAVVWILSAISGESFFRAMKKIPFLRKLLLAFVIFCPIINHTLAMLCIGAWVAFFIEAIKD